MFTLLSTYSGLKIFPIYNFVIYLYTLVQNDKLFLCKLVCCYMIGWIKILYNWYNLFLLFYIYIANNHTMTLICREKIYMRIHKCMIILKK